LSEKIEISATIVLYKENIQALQKTINNFLNLPFSKKLFLIDNSPDNRLENEFISKEITYKFVGKNIGFGAAHNLVISTIKNKSNYHLVLNPDIQFEPDTIKQLIIKLSEDSLLAMIAPKVFYPNKEMQFTCRKYPTKGELIFRRLKGFKNFTKDQEYRKRSLDIPFYPDFIHGCFMLFNTNDFVAIQGFDERYFLYMEDVDICKKIDVFGKKKMYFPFVSIIHDHRKGSAKNLHLLWFHISSVRKYFKKWQN